MSKVCLDIDIKDLVENIYTNNKHKELIKELGKIMEREDMVSTFFGYGELTNIIELMLEVLDYEELDYIANKVEEIRND
jgi:hypothetical protein